MNNDSDLLTPRSSAGARDARARIPAHRRRSLLVGVSAVAVVAGVAGAAVVSRLPRGAAGPSAETYAYRATPSDAPLPELWPVPAFRFSDQHGVSRTERDLLGRVWIADFIFTTCSNVCPMLSAQLALLTRELTDPELRFVSFSVDPAHDTPAVLHAYAQRWQPDESRWTLLATDPPGLAQLAERMHVAVEPTRDSTNPILHSSSFFLVDERGQVRGVYASNDDVALERLVADVARLRGAQAARPDPLANGEALYRRLACAGCHDNPRLAPGLIGLSGSEVRLDGGGVRRADADYVRDALTAPGRDITAGYLNLMPAYGERLAPDELEALVTHVLLLGANPAPGATRDPDGVEPPAPSPPSTGARVARRPAAAPARDVPAPRPTPALAEDPVCHMQVRVTPETPHATLDGKEHYFCSEMCRDRFAASQAAADR